MGYIGGYAYPLGWLLQNNRLPIAFDGSLTDYQMLCNLRVDVNIALENIANYIDDYKEYTDNAIAQLQAYIDGDFKNQLEQYTDNAISGLQTEWTAYKNQVDTELNTMRQELMQMNENNYYLILAKLEQFEQKILDMISGQGIIVYNPVTGQYTDVNTAIQDMYAVLRYQAFTAFEFDTSGITCDAFDDSGITCTEFDLYGKEILGTKMCDCYVHSPFTGLVSSVQDVFEDVVATFGNGMTATYFDNTYAPTATAFDNAQKTAGDFDFSGGTGVLHQGTGKFVITNSENTTLTISKGSQINYKYIDYPEYRLILIDGSLRFENTESIAITSALDLINFTMENIYYGTVYNAGYASYFDSNNNLISSPVYLTIYNDRGNKFHSYYNKVIPANNDFRIPFSITLISPLT